MSNIFISKINIQPQVAHEWVLNNIKSSEYKLDKIVKFFYSEEDLSDYVGGEAPITEEEGVSQLWLLEKTGTKNLIIESNKDLTLSSEGFIPERFLITIYKACQNKFESTSIETRWTGLCGSQIGFHLIKDNLIAQESNSIEWSPDIEEFWNESRNNCNEAIQNKDWSFSLDSIENLYKNHF
jgi:hypothetical protein